MKKYKEALLILVIVGAPVLFYLLIKTGRQNYYFLPVYGERFYDEQIKDTVFHTIPDFNFTNQANKSVSLADFDTSIIVADFFFASCPDICPKLNRNLSKVVEKTAAMPNVKYISHTVDPENDSVPVLAEYAARFKADPARWHFVTGSKQSLYEIAEKGYLVPVTAEDTTIDHTQNLILIDPWRRIRGYYDGLNPKEVEKLIDEIKVLQVEIHERNTLKK